MSKFLTAAEFEEYGKDIVSTIKDWAKANQGKPITLYESKKMAVDVTKKNGDDKNPILLKKVEQAIIEAAPALGIKVTKGMHASKDALVFSSTEEALQHLSNITGSKIVVATKEEEEDEEGSVA